MALDYAQSAALMADQAFRDRVKVACLKYAAYISDEAPNTPAHNSREKWAQQCYVSPDGVAGQVTPPVVMDGAVQANGESITDTDLQSAVENVVNKLM
jgi:hypothetical protein